MILWEYRIVSMQTTRRQHGSEFQSSLSPEEQEIELNKLGREGWELVAVDTIGHGFANAYLKRTIPRA